LKYGIQVEFIKPENVAIIGDIQQLQQVFVNLLVNAADALEGRDQARIVIRIVNEPDKVIITFSDNGQGFSPGFEENLFKPFFTTKEVGKGTGLGLAICQGIIENHGGEIMAKNIETGGACLTITLPRLM
jgi:C4-dicarboxylate-specific signal transduction histidine kinase